MARKISKNQIDNFELEMNKKQNSIIPESTSAARTDLPLPGILNYDDTTYFNVNLNKNDTLSAGALTIGKVYYILIKNTSTIDIVITLPVGDVRPFDQITIPPGRMREFSVYNNGLYKIWKVTQEMGN